MTNEPARNRARESHGAHPPVLLIHCVIASFNGRSE
jgi:hypothetical protein